jgi:hypothetical protein
MVNRLSLVPDDVLGHARLIGRFVESDLLGICCMLIRLKKFSQFLNHGTAGLANNEPKGFFKKKPAKN